MYPTVDQLSPETFVAMMSVGKSTTRHQKASFKASFQRCVARDVAEGRYTFAQAEALLESRASYGPEGRHILSAVKVS